MCPTHSSLHSCQYQTRFLRKILMCDIFSAVKQVNMAASSREYDYEESSVEYKSETSVINYKSDSNDTSFEASRTGYAHEPEYTACDKKKLSPSDEIFTDNCDDDDHDSSRLGNLHWCKNQCVILRTLIVAGDTKTW